MEVPWWCALCLVILCTIPSHADPVCKSSCRGAGGPFLSGNVYKYHVEGSTVTHLPGSPNAVTSLGISATAEVFSESSCQHVLKLSNVLLKGPDGKTFDGLNSDCSRPIKFTYNDGKLTELCGDVHDNGAGLNIKRAVISLLSSVQKQDSGSNTDYENDVFGICPTDFTFSKEGTKLTIKKTRNLNRCALREEFNFPFPTTPFQAAQSSFGAFETSPLLGAHLTVNQELDNGVLQKATGEESYTYRPLASPESGASIKVSYTLSLEGSSPGSIPANVNSPKGIYFEQAHDDDGVQNHDAITTALQKATAALDPVATPEAAKEFSNLVYAIEQGSKTDILQVYNAAQGKTLKNLFLDGLLHAGSAESVEAAAELLNTKQIPNESAIDWYLDLNFVKHASRGSLTSLLPLLSGNKVPYQAYLGIGAVAGKFCLEHQQLCKTSTEFKTLTSKLSEPLNQGCNVDHHEKENTIIASLKGLRNTRHLSDEVSQKVVQCASDKSVKSRVRVAAIEAFHADAGKPEIKQAAVSILRDVQEDSELRIKAYLTLVESPCPKVADTIKDLIDSEPINQVGSYIISHLRNLRASVNPEKEAAKQFLGNIISKKKYPIDQRKFSRNYEISYSLDALNIGAVGEVNRIFSQKSFIPRSVSFNLTTQLFGHSVNLAEIGLRAENLEWHLEKYFGPKGELKTKGAKFLDKFGENVEETLKKGKGQTTARSKRSVSKQETDSATSKVQLGPDYKDQKTDLDLSVKLFGSDIAWINYHHDRFDYDRIKNKLYGTMDEAFDKSKNVDIDYKKARSFLDAGVIYPTGLGFGLKVNLNGKYAVNIKVNGKLDVKAIVNNPKNAHAAFQVVPSGSLELSSLLAVDAYVLETGVKVSANLHSSTGTDLTVKVLDGYGLDVKLGLPVKKQDIFNFQSDVVSTVREKKNIAVESPIKFNIKRQDHGGCFDQLSTLTGLTFCGEFSVPMEGVKIFSPAYGSSKASLRIEKDDESLTAYHFKAFYDNKQPDQVTLEVLLDTPNSKTNRKFSLNVQGSTRPQKQLLINLESPFKQASFEGLVIDTESEQAISAKLILDGSEISFKAGAHVSGDGNRKKYEPLLEYKYPESTKTDRAWIGRKGGVKGARPHQSTLAVTGAVFVEKSPSTPSYRKYELKSVTLTTPKLKLTVDGTITVDTNLIATDLKALYEKETITLNSKIQKLEDNKYIAKIEFLPSQYPDLGGSIKWEYEKAPHKIENNIVVIHGPDLKSEQSRLSVAQRLTYKYESIKVFDFHTENTVTYPLLDISANVKGGVTPKSLQYDIDVTYDKNQVKSKLDAKAGTKNPTDYSIDFEAKAFGRSIDLTSKHDRVSPIKSKFTNSLELKPGGKYQLNALSELSIKKDETYQALEVDVILPQGPKSVKLKTEFKHNSMENEVELELIVGNKHLIDFDMELKKTGEPHGKFTLSLPKYVESQGSFETKGDQASGSFHVDIIKTGRKIEGSGELTKTPTHVKGSGEFLWDAKKDPNKKIHITTDTDFVGKSIDSKNVLQVLEYHSQINVKGSLEGSLADGTLMGDAEVVLPCGRIIAGKVNRVVHLSSDDNKIEGTWELFDYETKEAQPRKLILKIAGKNINLEKVQFDGQIDVTYVTPSKEDIILHLVGKKVPQVDKWSISGQGSVTGSLVKFPLHTKLNAELSEQLLKGQLTADRKFPPGHYDFELKSGNEIALNSNGKINQDQLNNEIEIKLPSDQPITSFKWQTVNSLNIFVPEGVDTKIVTSNEIRWNGDKFIKLNFEDVEATNSGHGKITWESHKHSARTLIYKGHVNEKQNKGDLALTLEWEGKTADVSLRVEQESDHGHLVMVSNVPDQGKFELEASYKKKDETSEGSIVLKQNDKTWSFSNRQSHSKTTPYIDMNLELPEGNSRFYFKLDKKEEHHALVESKISWITNGGGSLDLNGDINIKSIEDFHIKMFIDSPKLNLNKVEFEAGNKQTKSAEKTISFHGKSAEKEFSGSLSITSKGVVPNIDYEGHGSMKIGENTYPLEFKLKHTLDNGRRQGDLEVKAGKYLYSAHSLVEQDVAAQLFKLESWNKYCHDAGCKSDELRISSHKTGPMNYEIASDIKFDLSTHFFLQHPLLLKTHYKKEGWQYDREFEIEYESEKIQYHGFIKSDQAGAVLTLPKRIIAAEVIYDISKSKKPASYKIEASFWLDKKNNPADKTCLLLISETTQLPDGLSSSSAAHFNSPGLKELSLKNDLSLNTKDRVVSAKIEVDLFAKKNQKIVAEYKAVGKKEKESYTANDNLHIYSKGLNIEAKVERKVVITKKSLIYSIIGHYLDSKQSKREGILKLSYDSKTLNALIKLPEGVLYSADVTVNEIGKNEFKGKGKYELFGYKYEEEVEVTGTSVKATFIQKNDPTAQFDVEFAINTGQLAEYHVKFNQKPLVNVEVALDEAHFLKSKYNYNTDVMKDVVTMGKATALGVTKEASRMLKETGTKIANEVTDTVEDCRKALTNFKPATQYYQKELQQLKEEITSNKNVKNLVDFIKNTFGTIFSQISAIFHEITASIEHLISLSDEALQKVLQSIKATIPKLKENYEKASEIIIKLFDDILKYSTTVINSVLDKIKEHEKEIEEITAVVSDFVHDVGQLSTKTVGEVYREVREFILVLWDQITTLPAHNIIKEKLQELKNYKLPDSFWEAYHEIVTSAVQIMPTPELQQLLKSAADILEKILKEQSLNRSEALQQLYKEFIAAVRSVIAIIEAHKPEDNTSIPTNAILPVPSFALYVAPPGTFRLSLLNWIRSPDLPSISEIYHTYRPKHSPLDFIPPFKASALLLGETEFFTFDKKHYSFKGSCSYILSTDVIDGNFTVVANLDAGKLKSIAVSDHENIIELLHNNNVILNGLPADLPVHAGDLHLWRKWDSGTGFATNSGLMFFCTTHLKSCAFSINGFYFGKTRGLLGTYNNEPYDDTIIPDGKVAQSTAQFANSWKVNPQCPDGTVHEQEAPPSNECTKLFSGDSSLRDCFAYENPGRFREACNQLMSESSGEQKQENACNIALSYVGYCYYVHFVRVNLPEYCGKCQVGSQRLQIGESAPVKVPQKEADVVFVIEQLEENEELFKNLVTPLVSTLTNDLKEKGITDVKFSLVGYGAPNQKYPAIYTFNGKYDSFSGTAKNIHFEKKVDVMEPKLSDRIEDLIQQFQIETGTSQAAMAYKEALGYPFRPEALRTIVGVSSSDCNKAILPLQTMRLLFQRLKLLNSGLVFHLVAPLRDLSIEGKDEKATANLVGFDSNTVYTQGEAKRKVLKGDDEAFKNLKYTHSLCVDFTLGSNGAVFSSTNFIKGKPALRKNFLQVLSNKITDSLTTEEVKKECKCELERGMIVKTNCKIISRKEKEALTKGGGVKGGVKG